MRGGPLPAVQSRWERGEPPVPGETVPDRGSTAWGLVLNASKTINPESAIVPV